MTDHFFDDEDYAEVRRLIKAGDVDRAYTMLIDAEPVPAVAYQILRCVRVWARQAAQRQEWENVLRAYSTYTTYAARHRAICIRRVNQAPPALSAQDIRHLQRAADKLNITLD